MLGTTQYRTTQYRTMLTVSLPLHCRLLFALQGKGHTIDHLLLVSSWSLVLQPCADHDCDCPLFSLLFCCPLLTSSCSLLLQPCADHDRASGEGVLPQEYVLIKMEVVPPLKGQL